VLLLKLQLLQYVPVPSLPEVTLLEQWVVLVAFPKHIVVLLIVSRTYHQLVADQLLDGFFRVFFPE